MRRTINYDYNRLLTDLDFKLKLIEAKLKRQNAPEKIIDRIKNCFLIMHQVNVMVFMIYI